MNVLLIVWKLIGHTAEIVSIPADVLRHRQFCDQCLCRFGIIQHTGDQRVTEIHVDLSAVFRGNPCRHGFVLRLHLRSVLRHFVSLRQCLCSVFGRCFLLCILRL